MSLRLWAQNGCGDSNCPATSAPSMKISRARPVVVVAVEGLHADVADEPGEERAMHLLVGGGRRVVADVQVRGHLAQLAGEVAPLAHAHVREEVLAAGLVELAVGLLVREFL